MSDIDTSHVFRLYTLLLLKSDSHHGYEIIKHIEEATGERPSSSHIYPFLSKMEEQSLLREEQGDGDDRKTYSLTEQGEEFVDEKISSFGDMLYAAVEDRVKQCSHCNCRIYEGGYVREGEIFCCRHCADAARN